MNRALLLAALVLPACDGVESAPPPPAGTAPPISLAGEPGDPIPGLTAAELAAFERGRVVFERRFRPSEGLGPFYNATSCASCHSTPVTGGSSRLYRNFYLAVWGNLATQFPLPPGLSAIVPAFGSGEQHATSSFTFEGGRPVIPDAYQSVPVIVAQRNAVSLFGVGLFEFISNATITSNADPNDADGDGISGRFNTDFGQLGRFGVKAQVNNIELFTRGPLQNQMGVTSDPFLGLAGTVSLSHAAVAQVGSSPNDPTTDNDGVPDPEISHEDLGDLIAFTRFLAPPARKEPLTVGAIFGEGLFDAVGCTSCHIPSLPSSRGPVEAFSDLLLHEMGPELADSLAFGLPQASTISDVSSHAEFRTQPLWGVSMHAPFLHDGRAETLRDAIEAHGGEAAASRDAFLALPPFDQAFLIEFLEHL